MNSSETVVCYDWRLMVEKNSYVLAGFLDIDKRKFFKSKRLTYFDGQIAKDDSNTYELYSSELKWVNHLSENGISFKEIKL